VVAQRGTCFQVAPFNGCDRLQHTFDSLSNTHRDHHTSTSEGSPEHLQHTISAGSAWPFFLYLIYCDAAITLGVDFGTVSRSVAFAAPNFGFQWFNRPSGRAPAASPRFREIRCSASGRQGVRVCQLPISTGLHRSRLGSTGSPCRAKAGILFSPAQHGSLLVEPTRRYRQTSGSITGSSHDPGSIPVPSFSIPA
jgi:hypothetical protein